MLILTPRSRRTRVVPRRERALVGVEDGRLRASLNASMQKPVQRVGQPPRQDPAGVPG